MNSSPLALDANAFASLPLVVLSRVVSTYQGMKRLGFSHAYARRIALKHLD